MARPLGTWVETGRKTCPQCFVEKPVDEFKFNTKGIPQWCFSCVTSYAKEYMQNRRTASPEKTKEYRRELTLKKYNLTPEEFTYMVMEQGGVCAICGLVPSALYVDHDHATGKVRGLLCQKCNSGIGFLGDSLEGLEKAVAYLQNADSKEII